MILFFRTPANSVIATQTDHKLTTEEIKELCWLYGNAALEEYDRLDGFFIGPRREMITPWSTNAVEITQNMNLHGILRIEEYFPVSSKDAGHDPMLQRMYEGLDQDIFTVDHEPEPIKHVDNLEEYNEQEGLALSPEEMEYLHNIETQLGRPLTDSEIFGFAQINSEHCRHKIFGGVFIIDGKEMESSLFSMIKKTTKENPHKILSAYKDNVAFSQGPVIEQFAPGDQSTSDYFRVKDIESVISLKAETHNFPTTVEPFNGAATGTGGEIRDRMGGGTGSWPIAGTAVYMTSYPRIDEEMKNEELRMKNENNRDGLPENGEANDNSSFLTLNSSLKRDWEDILPVRKWLYQTPEQILIKASNGASDFGNKFGQPLITGSVLTFEHKEGEEKYAYDKVIMLAGGVGYGTKRDCLKKEPQKGNKVVVVGGDNYRIGLGGGSVSSVDTGRYSNGIELNAIQRANPEMQKRAYNLVRALCEEDVNPVVSIHDHGSAGHVNCLSELVEECGGQIDMTKLPVGDKTLSSKEIIANESQERMGLLIDEKHIEHVRRIAERERAPLYVVGETTGDAHFSFVQGDGVRPFDLDVAQMFGHSPKTYMVDKTVERHYEDVVYETDFKSESPSPALPREGDRNSEELRVKNESYPVSEKHDNEDSANQNSSFATSPSLGRAGEGLSLFTLNSSLNKYVGRVLQLEAVACKDWLTNKVDRSVTGKIARQQCQGDIQLPLSDCGVVALDYRGRKGIATAIGHAPQAGLASPEAGSVLSVAESLTNIVWAPLEDGLDSVSLSANWMWPCRSQEGEDARLYSAVKALSDFCCAIKVNVPTGKDSLSMSQQYPDGQKIISPGTVIVSSGGEVSDVRKVVSPVVVNDANTSLYHIDFSFDEQRLGGSAFAQSLGKVGDDVPTVKNPEYFRTAFNTLQGLIKEGRIMAGHDISAGGMITTLLEMCFANTAGGMRISLDGFAGDDIVKILMAENPGVVVQVADKDAGDFKARLDENGICYALLGKPDTAIRSIEISKGSFTHEFDIDAMRDIWYKTSYLLDRRQSMNGCAEARRDNYKKQPLQFKFNDNFTGKLSQFGISADRRERTGVKAAIIREKGTNGEREMAYSLYLAGFDVKDVMMTDLISGRETLEDINMIVFCGGFSNSDVLGSAKGWAGAFLFNPKAKEALDRFYARKDTLSLGICNGCQLMVELGLVENESPSPALPREGDRKSEEGRVKNEELRMKNGELSCGAPNSSLFTLNSSLRPRMLHNDSRKFESSFLSLAIPQNNSVMFGSLSGSKLGIWVAHGEGKFSLPEAEDKYNVVAKYCYSEYPGNPNGSDYDVAGICSGDGRHLAMMPHLERAIFPWQNAWYPADRRSDDVTPWIEAFVNARKWVEKVKE